MRPQELFEEIQRIAAEQSSTVVDALRQFIRRGLRVAQAEQSALSKQKAGMYLLLALQLSQGSQMPMQASARYCEAGPTFVGSLALVRRHLWHARSLVNPVVEAEGRQFPG